jgi:hypothetical protein
LASEGPRSTGLEEDCEGGQGPRGHCSARVMMLTTMIITILLLLVINNNYFLKHNILLANIFVMSSFRKISLRPVKKNNLPTFLIRYKLQRSNIFSHFAYDLYKKMHVILLFLICVFAWDCVFLEAPLRFFVDHICYYFTIIKRFSTMKWYLGSLTHPFESRNWYLQQELFLWLSSAENVIELSRWRMERETLKASKQRNDHGTLHTFTSKQTGIWITV